MTLRIIVLGIVAGAVGGAVGWLPGELVALIQPEDPTMRYIAVAIYFMLLSAAIGAALGFASGRIEGSRQRARRGMIVGALFGAVGGLVGSIPAELAFETLRGLGLGLVGRAMGWAIAGLFIGLAQGVRTRNRARILRGMLGGFLGGYLGGGCFELISIALGQGLLSRLAADVILGAALGGLIFAVEVWLSDAWLSVVSSGPQEGSRFDLAKAKTTIGSDEHDDILLVGAGIAPGHAILEHQPNGFWLSAAHGQVFVDGRPLLQGQRLGHESRFQVGQLVLSFQERRVTCSKCGFENVRSSKFCKRCGAELKVG
ncbi:MAG: hypothetical protein KDI55_25915 [Anaerolineae bacterium]|nr:hypothetical protein [Anaerolineae bacterium]